MGTGAIGQPVVIRSQTCDKHRPGDFFVKYAEHSGGCFADMSGSYKPLNKLFYLNAIP